MRKVLIVVLSVMLALGCFGALAGCKGDTDKIPSKTEAEKIAELTDVFYKLNFKSMIDGGGFKLTLNSGNGSQDAVMKGKKVGDRYAMTQSAGNDEPIIILDGYMIEKVDDKYELGEFASINSPLFMTMVSDFFLFPEKEFKLVEAADSKTLTYIIDIDDSYAKVELKFTNDNKITNVKLKEFESYGEINFAIAYGEQDFTIPQAALEVKTDEEKAKIKQVVFDAYSMYLLQLKKNTLGIVKEVRTEKSSTSEEVTNYYFTNNEYLRIEEDGSTLFYDDKGGFEYDKESGKLDYEYEKDTNIMYCIEMTYDLAYSAMQIVYNAADTALEMTTSGKTVEITCGDEKIVITDGRLTKSVYKYGTGENESIVTTDYLYNEASMPIPDAIKKYELSSDQKAQAAYLKRIEKTDINNIVKQGGLKITYGSGATATTITYDVSDLTKKGTIVNGESTQYIYGNKLFAITDGVASRIGDHHGFDFEFGYLIYGNDITFIMTDSLVTIKTGDKVTAILHVAEGGFVTKYEDKSGAETVTYTYTYGAQTVTIPDSIIELVK